MAQPAGEGQALDPVVEVGQGKPVEVDEVAVAAAELDDARRHQAAVDRKVARLQAHLAGAQAASAAAADRVDAADAAHKQSAGRE